MSDFPYRTVLITGASSGLGRGLAEWFAGRGSHVFAAARRMDALQALCASPGACGRIEAVSLDVSDADHTLEVVRQLDEKSGGLDLVIANAGIGGTTHARKLRWEDVARMIDVNVTGAAATLAAALPGMVERKRGHLVGMSSLAAWRGLPGGCAYSASKAFLATFLEGLRVDLAGSGVRVTCIHPGFVKSELTEKNKHPMPFLMETEDAVDKMGRAIVRGAKVFAYPWPTATAMRLAKLLPVAIYDLTAGKAAPKSKRG